MGSLKDQMIEDQEERSRQRKLQRVANYLGLTYDEVEEADPEIEPNLTSEDAHVGWDIMFPDDTPRATLDKMGGTKFHRVDVNFFDDGDEGDDGFDETEGGFIDLPPGAAQNHADQLRRDKEE